MIKRTSGAAALVILVALFAQASAQNSAPSTESGQAGAAQAQGAEQPRQQQAQDAERRGPLIYPTLAAGLIDMGVPVIDVRSEAEIEETGTVAGATHIPHTDIDAIAEFIGDDASRAVVLYCGSGPRVGLAIDTLRERGYHGMVNAGGHAGLREALQNGNDG